MKLDGKQFVLDTNILVYWLRGTAAGIKLKADYELGARRPRPIVPVVVKAEIKSLALQLKSGSAKQGALDKLLRELPIADISSEAVIDAYARALHRTGSQCSSPAPRARTSAENKPVSAWGGSWLKPPRC